MKIKSIKKITASKPIKFYDITVEDHHNFVIGESNIVAHNSSLTKALNKLARPFGNALQVIDGYGFFGSEVSPDPAAARYTSVKLSAKTNSILNQYKYLTTREPEGPYDPFWMEVPLGLTTAIVGIAVGYKTTILPRNLNHIKEFMDGKRKSVKPYFEGFSGPISKYKGQGNVWKLSSIFTVDGKKIQIDEIPPILKYAAVLKKLDNLISKFEGKVRIVNNSNTKVDISLIYTGNSKEQFTELQEYTKKAFSIIVTENPVFIKDGQVLVYDNIEQYLTDYKWQLLRLDFKNKEWEKHNLNDALDFNKAKAAFLLFMMGKKRKDDEITKFLSDYPKLVRGKLEALTARKFTTEELTFTNSEIKRLEKELAHKLKELNAARKIFEGTPDPTIERGVGSKKTIINLFDTDDVEEIDGMCVWDGDDVFEEEVELIEVSE